LERRGHRERRRDTGKDYHTGRRDRNAEGTENEEGIQERTTTEGAEIGTQRAQRKIKDNAEERRYAEVRRGRRSEKSPLSKGESGAPQEKEHSQE
jgi:hypothetical protein